MFWVYSALFRTLAYLASKGDDMKYQTMKYFGLWVLLYYFLLVMVSLLFVVDKFLIERESLWNVY